MLSAGRMLQTLQVFQSGCSGGSSGRVTREGELLPERLAPLFFKNLFDPRGTGRKLIRSCREPLGLEIGAQLLSRFRGTADRFRRL